MRASVVSRAGVAAAVGALSAGVLFAQAAPQKMTVESTAFKNGQTIPADYTADGKNVSPPLTWTAPAGTRELALILDDPDAPTPQPFVHWVSTKSRAPRKGCPKRFPRARK